MKIGQEKNTLNRMTKGTKTLRWKRSKKDRKEQRSSFRDILRTVEDAEPPNEKVKFGQEVLYLDSWDRKLQYEWFAKVGSQTKLID